jgi:ribosomal protein L29
MKKNKKENPVTGNVNELKKQLMSIRISHAVSGPDKTHLKKLVKKNIARLLTAKKA